jgi:hypothetical protein
MTFAESRASEQIADEVLERAECLHLIDVSC